MVDFNNDNRIIDQTVGRHIDNGDIHLSADDRAAFDEPYVLMSYAGNGAVSRDITITEDFEPSWGMIFRINCTPSIVDINNNTDYNYFGIFTKNGSTSGLSLSGGTLTVSQASIPVFGSELKSYNENGAAYMVLAFR